MQINYFEEVVDITQLEATLGVPIKSLTIGAIPTGEIIDDFDPVGNPYKRIVKKHGVSIEVETKPKQAKLDELDKLYPNLKRSKEQ